MDFNALKKRLGLRLKNLRQERGLRQEDLEECGFSYRYYGRLERGNVNPTLETIVKLCEIFEINLLEMFNFIDVGKTATEDQETVVAMINKVLLEGKSEKIRKLKIFLREIL